ncbi:MAG TPA: glycosyltransferase family 9 protein [Candidatus Acidoferrales bacterium]|nr:glycosyltransferase family 9 protein [Candidatus Acidoferrales bacterium]
MADERFLAIKLGSLGDLVFTLPAVAALRQAHPEARIDWVVDRRWYPLLEGNPDVNEIVILDHGSTAAFLFTGWRLRNAGYRCAIDFQGLYKSALLARLTGAPERLGFSRRYAREAAASLVYTRRVTPSRPHMVHQNLALVEPLGARNSQYRFPLRVRPAAEALLQSKLESAGLEDFFVLSPGGGWRSKCWPPERFGALHRELARRTGLRGVISYAPNERPLAEAARRAAGAPEPAVLDLDVAQLMALVRRARLVVAADSGPLHLAVALGTPVVGLYGPTAPERNGPFNPADIVVRNAGPGETTLRRGNRYSPGMLSITVEQVVAAATRRLEIAR